MNPQQTARELKAAQYVLSYGTREKPFMLEALENMIEEEEDNHKAGALIGMKVMYEGLVDEWRKQVEQADKD